MKNKIIIGIFLAVMVFAMADAEAYATETAGIPEDVYPQTFIATEVEWVSEETQLVTVETVTGFVYQFYTDAGDYTPGDLVACIMCRNGTPEITDDIILDANYSGIAEWFVEIYPNN